MNQEKLKRCRLISIILIGIAAVTFASWSCSSGSYSGTVEPLSIGSTHNEADTLIYVAYDQGFFANNGLNVSIKDYASGMAAVSGMLNGEVDIATASEFVIVQNAFTKQAIQTVGVISENFATQLVGRTDRGIRNVTDLEGKKVGVPIGTLAQFQFGRFLDLNGMHGKPVTLVNIDITQSVDILVNGDVDASQTWEPYVSRIKEKLGDRVVVWPSQNIQPQYKNLMVTNAWLTQHPDLAKRVLKSLVEADSFIAAHPDQAKTLVQKRLQYDDRYIASVWPLNKFSLFLNQSLLLAMEDEARWMIENKLITEKQSPDFRSFIYADSLKSIKPEAVNIR